MSSIIHYQNMLFLVGLKFNNLTGSVNTPLCGARVAPCVWAGVGSRSCAEQGGLGRMGCNCCGSGDALSPG